MKEGKIKMKNTEYTCDCCLEVIPNYTTEQNKFKISVGLVSDPTKLTFDLCSTCSSEFYSDIDKIIKKINKQLKTKGKGKDKE